VYFNTEFIFTETLLINFSPDFLGVIFFVTVQNAFILCPFMSVTFL